MPSGTESIVEEATLAWLESLGWQVVHDPDIAPETPATERGDYGQVVLEQRLRDALTALNPDLPAEALDDAFRKLARPEGPTLEARNRVVHRLLVDGVTVEYRTKKRSIFATMSRSSRQCVQAWPNVHQEKQKPQKTWITPCDRSSRAPLPPRVW